MQVPSIQIAEQILQHGTERNPTRWSGHSRVAAHCAAAIAHLCSDMDEDAAYVMGLLHDIGRQEGNTDMKHIIDGYRFMLSEGYADSARICLTHSFPLQDIRAYGGKNDCTEEETRFIGRFLESVEYNDYDRLIQLCDALAFPDRPVCVEKRLVDVTLRKGFNDFTIAKWKAFLELKTYFDKKCAVDIDELLQTGGRYLGISG